MVRGSVSGKWFNFRKEVSVSVCGARFTGFEEQEGRQYFEGEVCCVEGAEAFLAEIVMKSKRNIPLDVKWETVQEMAA